jgi:GT2 family glycosyltransferase
MPSSNAIAIVIVNWNRWRDTVLCLESVFQLENIGSCAVIVCDNGSSDGSSDKIEAWAHGEDVLTETDLYDLPVDIRPTAKPVSFASFGSEQIENNGGRLDAQLTLFETGSNLGFAGANNIAIALVLKKKQFSHIWFLNNDTIVRPDSLTKLLARANSTDQPDMVGSTLLYFSHPTLIQAQGGYWDPEAMSTRHIGTGKRLDEALSQASVESQMQYVVGASMLVSRDFIERVGLMDAELFLYFEELDWAVRGRPDVKIAYAPDSYIYHKEGVSTGLNAKDRSSARAFYFFSHNRRRIVNRYWPEQAPKLRRRMLKEMAVFIMRGQFHKSRILAYVLAERTPPEFADVFPFSK